MTEPYWSAERATVYRGEHGPELVHFGGGEQVRPAGATGNEHPMTVYPQPGDFAVCSAGGLAGRAVAFGEWLNGDGFGTWEHAFVYIGGGKIIQAEPGGANERPLSGHAQILWSSGVIPLTDPQRDTICKTARGYLGVPYSFLDYGALATHRLHIPAPGLKGYISSTGHMICSQLVDQCYADAGVHLFKDGRWPGYVTPAALAALIARQNGPPAVT